jgi:hypothetical protein
MTDMHDSSVIQTYELRLNANPYVCSTTFGGATLGTKGPTNELLLAFLYSDPDVGV